ncbi:MAG: glycosyltransferase family 39 protein [Vicinamibacterales bacterium]
MSTRVYRPSRQMIAGLLAILALGAILRGLFPAADPPWNPSVGVVWHDEGAWVHSARNRALYGSWTVEGDQWNPLFIAPVFSALEYLSFALFGVGVRQARLVSEVAGLASVLLLALGIRRAAGIPAGLIAGALLATNYVYVMYNRAAIMETTMVAFMVAAWYCYVRAQDASPDARDRRTAWIWGALAAVCALLAFFSKAAAAFFVLALGLDAVIAVVRRQDDWQTRSERVAGAAALVGLVVAGLAALALFVVPNWESYRFYNWQMSVTRKPTYGLTAFADRASWFPILHDLSTRMWFVIVVSVIGGLTALGRLRQLRSPERLLIWWVGLGTLELVLHDVGNERRFVFFIPALIGIAAMVLAWRREGAPAQLASVPRRIALLALPLVLFALYVIGGGLARVFFLYEIRPGVRIAASFAVIGSVLIYATWPRVPRWLARQRWGTRAAVVAASLVCAGDLVQYAQWAAGRTYKNIEASRALAHALPPDTFVHGKLANGLALENRIRPVFVGRGFGNYEDRKTRNDVRYILTYIDPRVGYEGSVIRDVLDAYPHRRIIMTFDVAETTGGHDRAALIDKFGTSPNLVDERTDSRHDRGALDRKDRANDR